MWKTIALAVAVLAPTAVPGLLHAAKDVAPAVPVGAVPAPGKSFAATCRGDQVLDSRPDPAWVGQSFAGDRCRAPTLPAAIDGARASRPQIVAAMAVAKQYQVAATAFERCVGDYVATRQAGTGKPLNQAELVIENHRVLVSQRARQRAQAMTNAAVEAFNDYGSGCADHG